MTDLLIDPDELEALLVACTPEELAELDHLLAGYTEPHEITLQPHQLPPAGAWRLWLLLAGRGAGKTQACAFYMNEHAEGPPCSSVIPGGHRMAIIAPTLGDAMDACVKGPSGLLALNPAIVTKGGIEGTHAVWPNGAVARLFGVNTKNDVERLRAGGNRSHPLDTAIATLAGWKPIEKVTTKDLVWTEAGLRPVLRVIDHGMKPVVTVQTLEGHRLRCTADHEVWVCQKGWTRADQLRPGDALTALPSFSGTEVVPTYARVVAPTTAAQPSGADAHPPNCCIGASTKTTTDRYRSTSSMSSITTITTRRITAPRTWCSLRANSTPSSTPIRSRSGAACRKAPSEATSHLIVASNAANRQSGHGSALNDAGDSGSANTLLRSVCGHASCAEAISLAPPTQPPLLAHAHVATVSHGSGAVPVMDLTIAGEHDFFAEGILVSNCLAWLEELAAWRHLGEAMAHMRFGLRIGPHPRAIGSTTPKNRPEIKALQAEDERGLAGTKISTATTYDNVHLAEDVKTDLRNRYENTRLGGQELLGLVLGNIGEVFQGLWFDKVVAHTIAPDDITNTGWKRVRYWDMAATEGPETTDPIERVRLQEEGNDPDWTAGALCAWNQEQRILVVEDMIHVRRSPAGTEAVVVQTVGTDGTGRKQRMEQEPGASGKTVIANYKRLLAGFPFAGQLPSGDKVTRAEAWAGLAETGRVILVAGPWNTAFVDECEEFTRDDTHAHDDMIDAVSGAFTFFMGPPVRRGGLRARGL